MLGVRIQSQGRKKFVRALLYSATQSSYVNERIMTLFKICPLRKEIFIHALFGADKTKPKQHDVFFVDISYLEGANAFSLKVFSERKICGYVPKIKDYKIFK